MARPGPVTAPELLQTSVTTCVTWDSELRREAGSEDLYTETQTVCSDVVTTCLPGVIRGCSSAAGDFILRLKSLIKSVKLRLPQPGKPP